MMALLTPEMILVFFLVALIVFLELRRVKETQSLLDRLMARNFPEYITYDSERRKAKISDKIERHEGIAL